MKAIQLVKYGKATNAFKVVDLPEPQAGPNEVCIKVEYSGLNFADVIARRGLYPDAPKNPAVLGYDVAGTVVSVGSDVSTFKPGDRVTALSRFGGYAEYVTTMQEGVSVIPDDMPGDLATALATQACTAYFAAEYMVSMRTGDKVLVHAAAGGVGSIICQLAKYRNCTIFGTASPSKQEYLNTIGVDHYINYRSSDFEKEILKITGKPNLDFAFDSVGGSTFKKSLKLLQPCGSIVSFGAASQLKGNNKLKAIAAALGFGFFSPIQYLMKSQSLIAVNMLRVADYKPEIFKDVLSNVCDLAAKGIIKPELAAVYPADDIATAHDFLESRKSIGKVVLQW